LDIGVSPVVVLFANACSPDGGGVYTAPLPILAVPLFVGDGHIYPPMIQGISLVVKYGRIFQPPPKTIILWAGKGYTLWG
jgi:hypothetical protein